jgi:hypothetical protein
MKQQSGALARPACWLALFHVSCNGIGTGVVECVPGIAVAILAGDMECC